MTINPADIAASFDDPYGRQPVEAVVAQAPGAETELLRVVVPSFDSDQVWELRWTGAKHDGSLPSAGDECLVVFTKQGTAWCSVWWGG